MEPLIVWTDASLVERGATREFALDLAYGKGESTNDLQLTLPSDIRLEPGSAVHVDGTGWGGMVDAQAFDTSSPGTLTWLGRSWQGVLAGKVIRPDEGEDYLVARGTAAECVADLIARCGLAGAMQAGECPEARVAYQYWRYDDAWHALYGMLASAGLRPTFSVLRTGGALRVLVGAAARTTAGSDVASEAVDFRATNVWRPVNHLVCLGRGELAERQVVDLYLDAEGGISREQHFFGVDEVCATYELSAAEDESELAEEGARHLLELASASSIEIDESGDLGLDVGDLVTAWDAGTDITVSAEVERVVVRIEGGVTSVERGLAPKDAASATASRNSAALASFAGGISKALDASASAEELAARAELFAEAAQESAGVAGAAAIEASQAAAQATEDAQSALLDAYYARTSAEQAIQDSASAQASALAAWADATSARNDAASARESSTLAYLRATEANSYALGTVRSLSEVQDVLGTLEWVRDHGTYTPTTDTTASPGKSYYTRVGLQAPYTWQRVAPSGDEDPSAEGWWELSLDQTLAGFTQQHLALMGDGLHVVPMDNGYYVVLGNDGLRVYSPQGVLVGRHGEGMQLGAIHGTHMEAEGNRLSFFSAGFTYPRLADGSVDYTQATGGKFAGEVAYVAVDANGESVFYMNRAVVVSELRFGSWAWRERGNGNLTLKWIGE